MAVPKALPLADATVLTTDGLRAAKTVYARAATTAWLTVLALAVK